ncbi:hypothetical protein P7C70_g3358, partial [Phenoliferia sp. Uapishka_3]
MRLLDDYLDPKPDEIVSLALRKLPATAPIKDRRGSLFINPGGPGGSGTSQVIRSGTKLSVILQGTYDIISWDPRGVNLTSPPLNCFETEGDSTRFIHDVEHIGLPYEARGGSLFKGNESSASELAWAYKSEAFQTALNGACEERGHQMLLRSSSTAFVVRDMVSILDALGEPNLNYWGFSYGTILGATFAAMFPDRVNRLILDGVSSAALYTTDMFDWGRSGMDDTMKTYQGFLDSCSDSGPKGCALALTNTTSPKNIGDRIERLRENLRSRPFAVAKSNVGPGILTTSDIQYAIFHSLYAPKSWPKLAEALAALESGNGTLLYEMSNAANNQLARKDPLDNVYHRSMESSTASTAAIMCSDTDSSATENSSIEEVAAYYRELGEKSITGEIWAAWITTCRQWRFKALEAYRGPWTVADGLRKTRQTKEELDMEIEAANERRSALEKQKSEQGRAEVDHAKAVAAKVHAAHEGGATLSPPDLESSVAAKRASVDKQQAELDDIEARLAAADAREAALKAALGL